MAKKLPNFRFFDYHRTIIGYHGTTDEIADRLVDGEPFRMSDSSDDWLGQGVYFWEYAPRQAWWWAREFRKVSSPAVVGAMIRLGKCFDLLDPQNVIALRRFHDEMLGQWTSEGLPIPENYRQHRKRDCAIFDAYYKLNEQFETCRAVYVPTDRRKRVWPGSWIYEEAHIQICVRHQSNVFAVWHVDQDGRYGRQKEKAKESS